MGFWWFLLILLQAFAQSGVSQWSDWTPCSQTCDHGTYSRFRTCEDACEGETVETKDCLVRLCDEHVTWSSWEEWGECSASCGESYRTRKRACVQGDCEGEEEIESSQCLKCVHILCPESTGHHVDCNFEHQCNWMLSDPDHWRIDTKTVSMNTGPSLDNTFQADCGNFVYLEGSNLVENQQSFIETSAQEAPTNRMCFSFYVSMYSKYVNEMGSLAVILHYQTKQMTLWSYVGVLTADDKSWHHVSVPIYPYNDETYKIQFLAQRGSGTHSDIAIDDIKLTEGECDAPVEGHWAEWASDENCDVTCGIGIREHYRYCTSPAPSVFGKFCVGDNTKTDVCLDLPPCPVNGGWGDWESWTSCPLTCGHHNQTQTRFCDDPLPAEDGHLCHFDEPRGGYTQGLQEIRGQSCPFIVDCPVDGVWGEWQDIESSTCSVTCGYGYYIQERLCNAPNPAGSGNLCDGLMSERRTTGCNLRYCPVNGNWGDWSEWVVEYHGVHTHTYLYLHQHEDNDPPCGLKKLRRTRECNAPAPDHGGRSCELNLNDGSITYALFDLESKEKMMVAEDRSGAVLATIFMPVRYGGDFNGIEKLTMDMGKWYPNYPSDCSRFDDFALVPYDRNLYGLRMWTYFRAPETGTYTFNAECGGYCQVFLSTNIHKSNTIKVIDTDLTTGCSSGLSPASAPISLIQNHLYYMEGLYVQLRDCEYFNVAFQNDGTYVERTPVTAEFLQADV